MESAVLLVATVSLVEVLGGVKSPWLHSKNVLVGTRMMLLETEPEQLLQP